MGILNKLFGQGGYRELGIRQSGACDVYSNTYFKELTPEFVQEVRSSVPFLVRCHGFGNEPGYGIKEQVEWEQRKDRKVVQAAHNITDFCMKGVVQARRQGTDEKQLIEGLLDSGWCNHDTAKLVMKQAQKYLT